MHIAHRFAEYYGKRWVGGALWIVPLRGAEMKSLIVMGFAALLIAGCVEETPRVTKCAGETPPRASEPAFKGMELYSWKPAGADWHFSLLLGTNRLKEMSEITAPGNTFTGIEELKPRLSRLAAGESVFWRNLADEPVPQEIRGELKTFCEHLQIKLSFHD